MKKCADGAASLSRRKLLGLAVLAPVLPAGLARAEAAPIETAGLPVDLAQAVQSYDRATIENDTAALDKLVADDYMIVNSDSTVQNKEENLADFLRPGFKVDPYVMQQPMRRVFGGVALTGGIMPLGWTQDGARHTRLLRVAHLWVRHERRWRISYMQLTRVPQLPVRGESGSVLDGRLRSGDELHIWRDH